MKKRIFIKVMISSFAAAAIFIGVGFFYLSSNNKTVQNEAEKEPYYIAYPESRGVLFDFLGDKTYFYLNFESGSMDVIYLDELNFYDAEIYGYPVDFTIKADYGLLGFIVDAVGGINLKVNDETFSFTGVQISELMETTTNRDSLRRQIAEQIILKISKQGFDRESLLYIIENSQTNLTIPDCYYWSDYIKEICLLPRYVN